MDTEAERIADRIRQEARKTLAGMLRRDPTKEELESVACTTEPYIDRDDYSYEGVRLFSTSWVGEAALGFFKPGADEPYFVFTGPFEV